MSPEQAARELERMGGRLERAVDATLQHTAERAQEEAEHLSQGTFSRRDLRRLGHPYGKRPGRDGRPRRPPQDPAIINDQGGPFARSWATEGPVPYGDGALAMVFNRSEEAEFVLNEGGTKFMIERPLPERVLERVGTGFVDELERAVRRAIG